MSVLGEMNRNEREAFAEAVRSHAEKLYAMGWRSAAIHNESERLMNGFYFVWHALSNIIVGNSNQAVLNRDEQHKLMSYMHDERRDVMSALEKIGRLKRINIPYDKESIHKGDLVIIEWKNQEGKLITRQTGFVDSQIDDKQVMLTGAVSPKALIGLSGPYLLTAYTQGRNVHVGRIQLNYNGILKIKEN